MTLHSVPIGDLVALLARYSWQNALHYFVLVALAFAMLWPLTRWSSAHGRPLPGKPSTKQLRREFVLSLCTITVGGAIAPAILILGWGRDLNFYAEIEERGWLYFFFSIFLMTFVRDTLFYWQHRAMHIRQVFRFAHRSHHLSINPNPLTGYSVHPVETLFAAVIPYLIVLFFIPKHPTAYLVFLWMDAAVGVVTHLGVEIFPRGFAQHWLGRWIGTSTAHQIHHATSRHNYGLYYLFWDRWMGTLDERYEDKYDAATGVVPLPGASASAA